MILWSTLLFDSLYEYLRFLVDIQFTGQYRIKKFKKTNKLIRSFSFLYREDFYFFLNSTRARKPNNTPQVAPNGNANQARESSELKVKNKSTPIISSSGTARGITYTLIVEIPKSI